MTCEHTVTCERCGQPVRVRDEPGQPVYFHVERGGQPNWHEMAEHIRKVLEDGQAQGVQPSRLRVATGGT